MIVDKARELGMAISQSDEFVALTDAKSALDANESLHEMVQQFNQMQDRMIQLLSDDAELNQIEVQQLSKDIDAVQTQLLENDIFSSYLNAQSKFQQLMKEQGGMD